MRPMPDEFKGKFYNSNIPCDMAIGACACGAWHEIKEWPKEVQDSIREKNE